MTGIWTGTTAGGGGTPAGEGGYAIEFLTARVRQVTSGVVDEKEGLYFAREGAAGEPPRPLHGPNQWPREQVCVAPCHCPRRRANARTGGSRHL